MDIGRILFRKSSRSTSKREIKWTKKNYYKVSQKIGRSFYVIVISEGVCKNRKTSDKIGAVGISVNVPTYKLYLYLAIVISLVAINNNIIAITTWVCWETGCQGTGRQQRSAVADSRTAPRNEG